MAGNKRIDRIVASAEKLFGQRVERVSAPGGSGRASFRVHLPDRMVIATLRPNFRRTHLEAFVLRRLEGQCDLQPRCLGVDGEIMFQSDVGGRRLNMEIALAEPGQRLDLAAEAVASILRIQAAGRAAGLQDAIPHLGQNRDWVENLARGPEMLADYSEGRIMGLEQAALCAALDYPGRQFVKWDCRSGNAAIGGDGVLRWFDFEYCGARHGAEDLAWLIGDEAWTVSPQDMERIVRDGFDPACGVPLEDYMGYLSLYLTFHCAQRLGLIVKEARKRGWLSKAKVRKYDDAGVHPEFAMQICRVGRHFADRNRLTAPIARDYEEAEQVFVGILREGYARAGLLPEEMSA